MCFPLENCCFCVSLDVGAKIISIINLAGSTMILTLYGTAAMLPPPVEEARKIVYAAIASIAMVKLLIGSLLVYGVFGKKPSLILPWLVSCYIFVISLVTLSVFGTVIVVLQYTQEDTTKEVSTMAAAYFVSAVILYWFGSVINSRRNEILEITYTGYDTAQGVVKEYRF